VVKPSPFRRPIRWSNLRADEAERVIRERVAENTDNVIISDHAFERAQERFDSFTFTSVEVYWILETGTVQGKPEKENSREWKVVVVKRMPGTREAGVVTLMAQDDKTLFVKTVEWMDWLS
jgi:hypothetical protein